MTTWHILRCMTMRERWLANELRRGLGLKTYVPMERNVVTLRGRRIERPRPIMPGYVFAGCIDSMPWHDIASTRHVIDWLTVDDDRPAVVTDAEIERIRDLEQMHNAALHDRRTYRIGERVRAKDGPFASMPVLLCSVRGEHVQLKGEFMGKKLIINTTIDNIERAA